MKKSERPAILGGQSIFARTLPLTRPALVAWAKLKKPLKEIISSGLLTKGAYLKKFEEKVAHFLGVKYAVATSSCTTGLILVLQALGLKGEVILPSFTFMATGHALLWNHLTPVFAEIRPETLNIDPDDVRKKITAKTSAMLVPHIFGNPADIGTLQKIAQKHGLKLIFDAAHGFGSLYQGKPLGRFGEAEVFSLSPTKLLVTGEGGVVTTNNKALAERLKIAREYGNSGDYDSLFAGLNARMQEFSAILGIANLTILEKVSQKRNQLARLFIRNLRKFPGIYFQKIAPTNRSSYKDLTILIDESKAPLNRDQLARALASENIETRNYYDPPLHHQTAFRQFSKGVLLPVTEMISPRALSLPLSSRMTAREVLKICAAIKRIFKFSPEVKKNIF